MNRLKAKSYMRRWQRVNAHEVRELRDSPVEVRFAQTAALMRMAQLFDWQIENPDEALQVTRIWNRLREKLRG